MSSLFESRYNPDVLSCIANLSNDEVFTPPEVANQVLDMLPDELWRDPSVTFLDPATKSGVFLREIAKRLIAGLEDEFPNLQVRLDHIFKHQLYGMAITELTSLLSRRSVYCSKYPTSRYSVVKFDQPQGNIDFVKMQHDWNGGRCSVCGAAESEYNRDASLETYAYEFIHLERPEEVFGMKFDVIVGNPPYQLSDSGHGASAMPIYQKFVQQAKKLNPRYIAMIIPSRWFSGGRGLDSFREEMLHDEHIRILHDYPDASDCFPGVEIKGGVCYFLRDRDNAGRCTTFTHRGSSSISATRPLLEDGMDTFIRYPEQISIFKKVNGRNETSFMNLVSANDPYGFDVREKGSYKRIRAPFELQPFKGCVKFYYNGWRKEGIGYVDRKLIRKGQNLVGAWKAFIPRVWGTGDPATDQIKPFLVEPNACSTETYLTVGPFDTKEETVNAMRYMETQFFHFMVALVKNTQQAMQGVYRHVPSQDFSMEWTDEKLFAKYELNEDEISFIRSFVRSTSEGGIDG